MPIHSIKPPEANLAPDAMIARAREMRGMLRAQQTECERAGRILPATHEAFVKAGFYRMMQPRRFGGYESDVASFHRAMIEIARGCPSSGWVLTLTAGHPLILARFGDGSAGIPSARRRRVRSEGFLGLRIRMRRWNAFHRSGCGAERTGRTA